MKSSGHKLAIGLINSWSYKHEANLNHKKRERAKLRIELINYFFILGPTQKVLELGNATSFALSARQEEEETQEMTPLRTNIKKEDFFTESVQGFLLTN